MFFCNEQTRVDDALTHPSGTPRGYAYCPGNTVYDNADAGLALMEAFDAEVYDNTFRDNKYGIRLSVGCANNVFKNNKLLDSTK